jgi:hypothetical protein
MVFGIGSSIAEWQNLSTAIFPEVYNINNRNMKGIGIFIIFVALIIVLTAGILWFVNSGGQNGVITPANSSGGASSSTVPTLVLGTPTGTTASENQSVTDGAITLVYPAGDFELATSSQQIKTHSYIPPCDANFNYCLYYIGTAYQGTNFDSAGIRVEKRTDLTTQTACLTTPPTGFTTFTPTTTIAGDYAVSEFTPLGDAGAGHYSTGTLYRMEYNGACYEFETRIGQSQFANYPSGTIQQFTNADQASLQTEIVGILNGIALSSGETVVFPN